MVLSGTRGLFFGLWNSKKRRRWSYRELAGGAQTGKGLHRHAQGNHTLR